MELTPEIALRWLNDHNTHNRPLRQHLVQKYAQAMARGEWILTAEPIAFSRPYRDSEHKDQGVTLINGQHRLWAVVESGVAIQATVWWGCEPEEFSVIDQNAPRTFGDVLATTRKELPDPTAIAAVAKNVLRYAFGLRGGLHTGAGHLAYKHIEKLMKAFEPEVLAVVEYRRRLKKMASRTVTSTLFLAHLVNPAMTARIVEQLHDAVGFTERDPIRALHLYLAGRALNPMRDSEEAAHYKVCHAICARLRGDHIKVLRLTTEGLAWLRDAARPRIHDFVADLHGGSVPRGFYKPANRFENGDM